MTADAGRDHRRRRARGDDGRASCSPAPGSTSWCSKSTPTSSAISAATRSTPRRWRSSTSSGCSSASWSGRTTGSTSARIRLAGRDWTIGDLSHLDTPAPFIAMMPQWDFLDFLRDEAAAFPDLPAAHGGAGRGFRRGGRADRRGAARRRRGAARRRLVIAADGRSSLVRQRGMLPVEDLGAPMDVFWFQLPKTDDGGDALRGMVEPGPDGRADRPRRLLADAPS